MKASSISHIILASCCLLAAHPPWFAQGLRRCCWGFGLMGALTMSTVSEHRALAQSNIVADDTLGAERSLVIQNFNGLPIELITGGAARGQNLFHSFVEFNVTEGRGAYFSSPADIQNILARVTGSNRSEILGMLGTFGNSTPSLFLINPNGILFGANASLDVGGSFVATTANAIGFGNLGFFGASTPNAPSPLLTINPSAFLFNQITSGQIENSSIAPAGTNLAGSPLLGLRVPDNRSLLLVGGNVVINQGGLHAPGGRVELAGIAGAGSVGLNMDDSSVSLNFPEVIARADISLTNVAMVTTSGEGGGSTRLWGRRVTLNGGSGIESNTLGSIAGGGLTVDASESVQVIGESATGQRSGLFAEARGVGDGGDIIITTPQLRILAGAKISTGTFAAGNGGDLTVNAPDLVLVTGFTRSRRNGSDLFAQSNTEATGVAGNLTVTTRRVLVSDGGQIGVSTFGAGNAGKLIINASESMEVRDPLSIIAADTNTTGQGGDLMINTGRLLVQNLGQISASTLGTGNAGRLIVNASESVQLSGQSVDGRFASGLFTGTYGGSGRGGELQINTPVLLVEDGGGVSAVTLGEGEGGQLVVNASESVRVRGGFLSVPAWGSGNAGNLTIRTRQLVVQDVGQIDAATIGAGNAGRLVVNASESVQLSGRSVNGRASSGLFTGTYGGTGRGGELQINTPVLLVEDGAVVEAATRGEGEGGSLTVNAPDSIQLSGRGSLSVEALKGGTAGSLSINTRRLTVEDGAEVSVSSPEGQAGNLTIAANSIRLDRGKLTAETGASGNREGAIITLRDLDLLLLSNGSQISARAFGDARGGNVIIEAANGFLVAIPREDSDIIASAALGRGGEIQITAQGIFDLKERRAIPGNGTNDIDASSEFGLAGTVTLNTPDVDPSRGLAALPTNVVDPSQQIAQGCTPMGERTSRFVATGRGGLPLSPDEPLRGRAVVPSGWLTLDAEAQRTANSRQARGDGEMDAANSSPTEIVEANGWVVDAKGNVVLVASAQITNPVNSQTLLQRCLILD